MIFQRSNDCLTSSCLVRRLSEPLILIPVSLLAAMSRGRRLLYTIPAITPCMQRKIIVCLYGILTPCPFWWPCPGGAGCYTPSRQSHPACSGNLASIYTVSWHHLLVGGHVQGGQVVVHHPGNHTLHAAENYHLFVWNLDTIPYWPPCPLPNAHGV